jgi:hypothetical protein
LPRGDDKLGIKPPQVPRYTSSPIAERFATAQMIDQFQFEKQTAQRHPSDSEAFVALANERIEYAMQEGEFDNLPARPINDDVFDANLDSGERIFNRILRNNDAVPPWIDQSRQIDTRIAALRDVCIAHKARQSKASSGGGGSSNGGSGSGGGWFASLLSPTVSSAPSPSTSASTVAADARHETLVASQLERINADVRAYNRAAPGSVARRALVTRSDTV